MKKGKQKMNYKFSDFVHGQKFRATIDGVECEGRVSIEDGDVYLCQNEKDGAILYRVSGYKYTWRIFRNAKPSIGFGNTVTNLTLYPEERTLDSLQKGDVVVDLDGDERMVYAADNGYVVVSMLNVFDQVNTNVWELEHLKSTGYTLKPTPQPKWEPKEGEEVCQITLSDSGFLEVYNCVYYTA
jgi:hypothetical protein